MALPSSYEYSSHRPSRNPSLCYEYSKPSNLNI